MIVIELTEKELKEIVCNHFKIDIDVAELRVIDKLKPWQLDRLIEDQNIAIKEAKQNKSNNLSSQMSDKSVNNAINSR